MPARCRNIVFCRKQPYSENTGRMMVAGEPRASGRRRSKDFGPKLSGTRYRHRTRLWRALGGTKGENPQPRKTASRESLR